MTLLAASLSHAQSVDIDAKVESYAPDYFAAFAPQTAADMVARIPGFAITGSEGSERGFGQASLNILINGRRPSSKSSGANEILRRIPAATVTRIEIVDGAALDIPGLSGQVANIIAKSGMLSGQWNYAMRFEEGTEPQLADAGISLSAKRGNLEIVGSVTLGEFQFTENGTETFFNADGSVAQDRIEQVYYESQSPNADLNLTLNRDNGDVANLNLSGGVTNTNQGVYEDFTTAPSTTLSGQSVVRGGEDEKSYEIGGDYAFDVGGLGQNGRLKLIALHRYEDSEFPNTFYQNDFTDGIFEQRFDQDDVETEYIGRGEYTWKTMGGHDWTASLEGAFNRLDSETSFSANGSTPALDAVEVEEQRAQANLSQSWAVNPKLRLQASLGAEYSVIDVVSDNSPSRNYFRPKGFLSGSYKIDDHYTLRAKAERTVGQLNFDIFVSTQNLSDGTANASDRGIVPVQEWAGEIELRRQAETGLSGAIELFAKIIEDPIDVTPRADGTQGFANLDDNAAIWGLTLSGTWVGDGHGAEGLRLGGEIELQDSRLTDPLTGEKRDINGLVDWFYEVEARYDIPNSPWAFFAEAEGYTQRPSFRLDEIQNRKFLQPETEAGIIHKDLLGMQWTLKLQNLLDYKFRRQRSIFDGDRFGDFARSESYFRQRGRRISIEITDTF